MISENADKQLEEILTQLDLKNGDTIYVSADIANCPLPQIKNSLTKEGIRSREQKWCEFIFNKLFSMIGSEGTLLVPTFSYTYARHQKPFYLETTPSETGPFTEFVRNKEKSVRSLHPIFSVTGIGKNAKNILGKVGKSAYGIASPFMKLSQYSTKFVFLGTTVKNLTYFHHLEHLYGVNHMYHNVFTTPVYYKNKQIPGPWLAFVRYLGIGINARIENLEISLKSKNLLCETQFDNSPMQSVTIENVNQIGIELLSDDPYGCINKSVEVCIKPRDFKRHRKEVQKVVFQATN
jgi:aminoglycoside 3-N-acetyltransferase